MKIFYMAVLALAINFSASCKEETKVKPAARKKETNTLSADAARRAEIVAYARQYLGTSYCYASADPAKGFDCSGFVNYVFKHFGIELPRSSSGFKDVGPALQPENFKVGDIVVFYGYKDSASIGHIGIITEANGMKSKFIHASSGKDMAVIISDLASAGYTRRFYKAVNVLDAAK